MNEEKINWEVLALTRFFLASIVMIGHLQAYSEIGYLKWYTYFGSFESILGFLLISGFSIGKSISHNRDSYFKRRIQRIYPVYAVSVIFQMIVIPSVLDFSLILTIIINLLFLNQVFTGTSFLGVSWTLAAEVWLYGFAPYFYKMKIKYLYILIFISFFSYCLYTCGRTLFHWNYYSGTRFGINLVLLAFIWIAGFVLAIHPYKRKFTLLVIAFLLIGHQSLSMLIQLLYRFKHNDLSSIVREDLAVFIGNIFCLGLVYAVVYYNNVIPSFSSLGNKIFKLLGDISYPLYLTHCSVFLLFNKLKISNYLILISGAILFSYLIYYIFDSYSKKRTLKENPKLSGSIN